MDLKLKIDFKKLSLEETHEMLLLDHFVLESDTLRVQFYLRRFAKNLKKWQPFVIFICCCFIGM